MLCPSRRRRHLPRPPSTPPSLPLTPPPSPPPPTEQGQKRLEHVSRFRAPLAGAGSDGNSICRMHQRFGPDQDPVTVAWKPILHPMRGCANRKVASTPCMETIPPMRPTGANTPVAGNGPGGGAPPCGLAARAQSYSPSPSYPPGRARHRPPPCTARCPDPARRIGPIGSLLRLPLRSPPPPPCSSSPFSLSPPSSNDRCPPPLHPSHPPSSLH